MRISQQLTRTGLITKAPLPSCRVVNCTVDLEPLIKERASDSLSYVLTIRFGSCRPFFSQDVTSKKKCRSGENEWGHGIVARTNNFSWHPSQFIRSLKNVPDHGCLALNFTDMLITYTFDKLWRHFSQIHWITEIFRDFTLLINSPFPVWPWVQWRNKVTVVAFSSSKLGSPWWARE